MPNDAEHEYVWVTIDTAQEKLLVYHDSKLIVEYPYLLPKSSIDLSRLDLWSLRCLYIYEPLREVYDFCVCMK